MKLKFEEEFVLKIYGNPMDFQIGTIQYHCTRLSRFIGSNF